MSKNVVQDMKILCLNSSDSSVLSWAVINTNQIVKTLLVSLSEFPTCRVFEDKNYEYKVPSYSPPRTMLYSDHDFIYMLRRGLEKRLATFHIMSCAVV